MAERDYTVPAVARALEILEFVGNHESPTMQDIVEALSLPKTSAYQMLRTLLQRGYLRQTRIPGGYALGLRLFALGNQSIAQLDIRSEATPVLYELMRAVQQTCHLGVLEGNEAVYLAKVDCPQSVAVRSWVGKRFNLQTTAMGKVLLAWRNVQEARTILLDNPPPPGLEGSSLNIDEFLGQLPLVRERKWALDDNENTPGIRCVAAPVFGVQGAVVAAISISASSEVISDAELSDYSRQVCLAAEKLSERIGYNFTASSSITHGN